MGSDAFEVVVVGAGMGGLLAAAMLGREGRRVVVLERQAEPGGRLRSFDEGGFVVDAGAYLWPNAWMDDAFDRAGVTGFRGSTVPPGEVMRVFVEGHAGKRFSFPWPGRAASPKLLEVARTALGIDADGYRKLAELWRTLAEKSDEEVARLRHVPAREALARLGVEPEIAESFLRNVMCFGTYDPGAASMAECIGLHRRTMEGRGARPECAGPNPGGGVRALVHALVDAATRAGVRVRCGVTVEEIAVEAGRVTGVRVSGGDPERARYEAPIVVCNVPCPDLPGLLPVDALPPDFARNARSWRAIGGVVAAAFGFEDLPVLRETGRPDEFRGWTRLLTGPEADFGGGCLWSSHHSPANAPAGKHVLQAMRLTPHAELDESARVAEIQAAFDTMIDEIYLDARDKLLWKKTWVTRDGTEYLIHAAPRPSVRAPGLEGLYLVGETTDVPALQMDAAALSALRCADLIAGRGAERQE